MAIDSLISDTETGKLIFVADVPEGAKVQIANTTREKIITAAKISVEEAMEKFKGKEPAVALCFSCAGRKHILGTRVDEEFAILKEHFPNLPFVGFYAYGEIGQFEDSKPSRFHNETFVSLLIGEK